MRLIAGGLVQACVKRAIIALTVELNIIGWIKRGVGFSLNINGLFNSPMKELNPPRINGTSWKPCVGKIGVG